MGQDAEVGWASLKFRTKFRKLRKYGILDFTSILTLGIMLYF